ncbi:MAG TPA: beta-ketoacyl-ACP synthase [Beijerinckiaceae bacterium]|nr:beta-ketoacyl-ACP synthase [Beijerinckiaceae bacterium]
MMREVVITGVGLVSCVGEDPESHLAALASGAAPRLDTTTFAPYAVHPAVHLDYDRQIPKKSDQRQMEPWQRLGVYAAGLALETAGAKADAALKGRMHLIVAAGGGERDYAVDGQILTGIRNAADPGVFLNERLMSDLRPTLFLAQLSNLLAGNISIVHGVTGASRTFMGEESAGLDAIRVAHARIAAGQGEIFLVGGAYNAERPDVLLMFELGGFLWKKPFRSVWDRPAEGGGFIPGSGAAFLVMEAREHAQRRGATPLAAVAGVVSERTRRTPGALPAALARHWATLGASAGAVVLSGATGLSPASEDERAWLAALGAATIHATGDLVGHTVEAQAPTGAVLATALLQRGAAEAVVTSVGHWRGDGAIRLTRAE